MELPTSDNQNGRVVPYTLDMANWSDYPVQDALPRPSSGEVPYVFKDWENYPVNDALPKPKPTDVPYNFDVDIPAVYHGTPEAPKVDENGIEYKERPKEEAPKKVAPKQAVPKKAPVQTSGVAEQYVPDSQMGTASADTPANPSEGWFGDGATGPSDVEQAPMTDPHRSVLQAIMGWDDVPYGKKWNHYLQHGLVGVSKENVDNVTKMASLENKGGLAGAGATYGQELRARETKRRTLMNQWDKLLADWNAGRYTGDEQTLNWFYQVANNLREEIAAEGINPNTLRPPSINAGGFAQGFQKTLADDREKLDWLGGWLEGIQKHAAENPNWLNSIEAQAEFDKLSEYVVINWAQSKGAIADAEKVRAQVETMPQADRQVFDTFMKTFFNANAMAQVMALAEKGDYSALQTVDSMYKLMGMANDHVPMTERDALTNRAVPNQEVSSLMDAAVLGYLTLVKNQENIPPDVAAAVNSYKNARDAYLEYTMQNANVDRQAVWNMAMDQLQMYQDKYNGKVGKLGLNLGGGYQPQRVDRRFGDHLRKWQDADQTSEVMRDARLGIGDMPKRRYDNIPLGNGGRGGGAVR